MEVKGNYQSLTLALNEMFEIRFSFPYAVKDSHDITVYNSLYCIVVEVQVCLTRYVLSNSLTTPVQARQNCVGV